MTRLLEVAVETALELPPDRQDEVAGARDAGDSRILRWLRGRRLRSADHRGHLLKAVADSGREIGLHVYSTRTLLNHMISHPGVRFVTLNEMADDFARRFPRER